MRQVATVLLAGVGLSFQDFGRPGWRRFGIPPGGAMDRFAAAQANRLLGNPPQVPVLEILLQGAILRIETPTWVALCGADLCPTLPAWTARELAAGTVLEFSGAAHGLWAYLAVPGGFEAPRWFGSAASDARIGVGATLETGTPLSAARQQPSCSTDQVAQRLWVPEARARIPEVANFRLLPGPQFERFSVSDRRRLAESRWQVSTRSDRSGFRLEGPRLQPPTSIASEPVLPGSIQVPGGGQPIVTLYDGPTVGGYPKPGILRECDLDRLVQCRPKTEVSFTWDI